MKITLLLCGMMNLCFAATTGGIGSLVCGSGLCLTGLLWPAGEDEDDEDDSETAFDAA
jgi:hypothetical protein